MKKTKRSNPLVYRCLTMNGSEYLVDFYSNKITVVHEPGARGLVHSYSRIGSVAADEVNGSTNFEELLGKIEPSEDPQRSLKPGRRLVAVVDRGMLISDVISKLSVIDSLNGRSICEGSLS